MDEERYLIFINGQDRTASVSDFCFRNDVCEVIFSSSTKVYRYRREKVQVFLLQSWIDPNGKIITVKGNVVRDLETVFDFGPFYRVRAAGGRTDLYKREELQFQTDCLANEGQKKIFDYFKETAEAVSLLAEGEHNILGFQYDHIREIGSDTALACYLNREQKPASSRFSKTVIYPFGLNQSQKLAVENALCSQISIIQGPPGTGKTQTILNIIANVIRNGMTVAVVSNNNSATLNVIEKLEKKQLGFLAAFLGSRANKDCFLSGQSGRYPDMQGWAIGQEEMLRLNEEVADLSAQLNEMLNARNRIAAIEQELLQLEPEQHYFEEYCASYPHMPQALANPSSSQRLLSLWLEFEQLNERKEGPGLHQKLFFLARLLLARFDLQALKRFSQTPELVLPCIQRQFYVARQRELTEEKAQLEKKLADYAFEDKMTELTDKSLRLLRAELGEKFSGKQERRCFQARELYGDAEKFVREYPVVLSTTYSIKTSLNPDHIYDYLIVDEASQADLATGVLALSCARNAVIVGDLQQLPNVLDKKNIESSEAIWNRYSLPENYRFSKHSLLSSALATWPEAPAVLLREHYRCHPKIINFCNQKFYHGELIVMTEDHKEPDVLTMYCTAPGNHARGHQNQRQIDVIREEVLPRLRKQHYDSIGIITPYRDQVAELKRQLGDEIDAATVHKFQGREKEAIVLTSVDNTITDFVDDPRMLNVAVSRAVKSLTVVTSRAVCNGQSNYGELSRYIEYNNCAVVESSVHSVFDLLYQGYAQQRAAFLKKRRRISEYDSENLMYSVIQDILKNEAFSFVSCAVHVSLGNLIRDYARLTDEEKVYARNPLTHVDFLLFNRMDKAPILAIEVDGVRFHQKGSRQAARDELKNSIFQKSGLPLLRLRTDESGEQERIRSALQAAL